MASQATEIQTPWQKLVVNVAVSGGRRRSLVTSPIDGAAIGKVPIGTPDDVRQAAVVARAAQQSWAATPVRRRAGVLNSFRYLLIDHLDELLELVHRENGKSYVDALEEVLGAALTTGYYAANAARILRTRRRQGAIPLLTQTKVGYRPKGLVGIVSPWNYPLVLPTVDAVAALAAGNAVILKPDSQTPFTSLYLAELLRQAGLPFGVFQVVTGPGKVLGPPLVESVDHVMFTGSVATARVLATLCAEQLKSFDGELGGKNAMLVLEDASLERAVEGALNACFSTTGQLCLSIERVYVNSALYHPFCAAFVRRVRELRLGGASGWHVDLGPLAGASQLAKVEGHVADAVAKGAKVLTGGRARPDLGEYFYEPTVLTEVTAEMEVFRAETFGPVVSLYEVANDEEAVAAANDTEYGLNASVWSRDVAHARSVAKQLQVGTVNINEGYAATFGSSAAPMGGVGISGIGRRNGPEGLLSYTEPQTIAVQRLLRIAPPPFATREQYARVMAFAVKLLHPKLF